MHPRAITFVLSALTVAGLGLAASAQQKPAAASRASSTKVVVYKSPT